MNKRRKSESANESAFEDFRKNVYPLVLKHAGDDFMDYHICLICHPSGELEIKDGKLPSYLYKCVASKKTNGEISFKNGYRNLLAHFDGRHDGWRGKVEDMYKKGESQLKLDGFLDKKASTTYNWMELILGYNLPGSYVEEKAFAINGSRPTMSYETFLKRMKMVMNYVEELIRKRLARYLSLFYKKCDTIWIDD
jgi:hypothetical protein